MKTKGVCGARRVYAAEIDEWVSGQKMLCTVCKQGRDRLKAEWPRLRQLHHEAMTSGLANDDVAQFSAGALEICGRGLERRGFGESAWLRPLFSRLQARENPAQMAQAALEARGIEGLVTELRIRP